MQSDLTGAQDTKRVVKNEAGEVGRVRTWKNSMNKFRLGNLVRFKSYREWD